MFYFFLKVANSWAGKERVYFGTFPLLIRVYIDYGTSLLSDANHAHLHAFNGRK